MKLLPLKKEYLEFVREVRNNPQVNKHLFTDAYISKENQEKWYRRLQRDKNSLVFVAITDEPVGYCQVKNIDYVDHSCELGFCIAPEYQDKGYGTSLTSELVNYATKKLNMHRLYLEVFADNEAAIKLYEKSGFRKEGILRDNIFKNGIFHDVVVMSFIAGDNREYC